ncbi:MAG: SDR family oxidoreductase, partial [Acidobacteria bacterium]|nr:SDR family oxidoreductase [Acidobacteriota bacterium]
MNNRFDLTGKVALVTGGGRGLGKAMARGLAEAGASIMLASRTNEELEAASAEVSRALPVRVEWLATDMTDREQLDRLASEAMARFGRVDILINNAGGNVPQPVDAVTDEAWDRIVELNLTSCMRLTRALTPQMKTRGWGRIIHISSVLGLGGKAGRSAYSSTKSALIGFARASAMDLGPHGITVNCIAPGPFLTDLPAKILTEEQKKEFTNRTALGRWGNPEEMIGPALLLASDAGSYITGTT